MGIKDIYVQNYIRMKNLRNKIYEHKIHTQIKNKKTIATKQTKVATNQA